MKNTPVKKIRSSPYTHLQGCPGHEILWPSLFFRPHCCIALQIFDHFTILTVKKKRHKRIQSLWLTCIPIFAEGMWSPEGRRRSVSCWWWWWCCLWLLCLKAAVEVQEKKWCGCDSQSAPLYILYLGSFIVLSLIEVLNHIFSLISSVCTKVCDTLAH